jgi:hypothetical protein
VTSLAPGGYVLVVKKLCGIHFALWFAHEHRGRVHGNLDNSGERITLVGPLGEPILDFTYNDRWYPATDGQGFALITVNESAAPSAWDMRANWRASRNVGGSPGVADPAPQNFPPVIINEVLTHTDRPRVDAIELFNTGTLSPTRRLVSHRRSGPAAELFHSRRHRRFPRAASSSSTRPTRFNLNATNFALSSEVTKTLCSRRRTGI